MAGLREEFLAGVRAELPLLRGVVPFGMIFGVLGLAAGLPGWAVVLSSSLIFGGLLPCAPRAASSDAFHA